jgi:hypothetical protein
MGRDGGRRPLKGQQPLVSEEEATGGLVCPPTAEGAEPVLQLKVVARVGLVEQELQVVEEQLVVQEQPQRGRAVLAENKPDVNLSPFYCKL